MRSIQWIMNLGIAHFSLNAADRNSDVNGQQEMRINHTVKVKSLENRVNKLKKELQHYNSVKANSVNYMTRLSTEKVEAMLSSLKKSTSDLRGFAINFFITKNTNRIAERKKLHEQCEQQIIKLESGITHLEKQIEIAKQKSLMAQNQASAMRISQLKEMSY